MEKDIAIKLGDYEIINLDSPNPANPGARVHMAFVRYNGMMPRGNSSVLAFEIGSYHPKKQVQNGKPYYLPENERTLICRIDTYGRKVRLRLDGVSPLEIKATDMTERQSAVRD